MDDSVKYEKLDYLTYKKRLEQIDQNEQLRALGMQKRMIGVTKYNYGLYDYVIGNGQKDLFIIGGTHGSEIIGVDFVTQLLAQVPNLQDFDPNMVTLHIIPNINPEGFDITTSTLQNVNNDNLKVESFDYYLRYRTDNVINAFINKLDNKLKDIASNGIIKPNDLVNAFKGIFEEKEWANVCANNAIPRMRVFEDYVKSLGSYSDYSVLFNDLRMGINKTIEVCAGDVFLCSVLKRFETMILSDEFLMKIVNNAPSINKNVGSRLYQEKFENMAIIGTQNPTLSSDVATVFEQNNIPSGAQVKFDPNGSFINLNQNTPYSTGIEAMQNGDVRFGPGPSNNVRIFTDGAIGKPTENPYNFEFAIENQILNTLLAKSAREGRLAGALIYHGTGGLVYSKPYQTAENEHLTSQIATYNAQLSDVYKQATGYRQIEEPDNTGYGDLLRQTYPGILLIELSKMGGNPIAPYGDQNNIQTVMNDNIVAVNDLINKVNELIKSNETVKETGIIL